MTGGPHDRDDGPLQFQWEFDLTDVKQCSASRRKQASSTQSYEWRLNSDMLTELQKEVVELENERGTAHESLNQKCLLLTEEVFEVMKWLRAESGIATSARPKVALGDELADVLFVSAAIANRVTADLGALWADYEYIADAARIRRTFRDKSAVLTSALQLAKQVLVIVTTSPNLNEDVTNDVWKSTVTIELQGVLVSIDQVATASGIDLARALNEKLQKDQLRLWQ